MARIKYFNKNTGIWEYADSQFVSGGKDDYVSVEPAEDDIPKVFITGEKPTTKDDVTAEMEYISKTERFFAYLKIKCQGSSSMSYPKKNYTVKLYSDEARETELKKEFKHWDHSNNKFVLKANYIDHSHARNIISARLWGEVVASRQDYASLPAEMRNAPNNGAVDGFPVKVYYNGNYEGIYTWNIGKDDWMWGMNEANCNHVLLCAEENTDGVYAETPCNFRALWSGINESYWSVEVGENSESVKNSLNALISCVKDTNDDIFKATIGNYLDVQSAIDYYIHQYVICGLDGLAKNMLLATYDGTRWICGAYDMDSTFGLFWNGTTFVPATYKCPEDYQEPYSLLWERITALFADELKNRYIALRKTVYSYSNMVTHFERFSDIIGSELYAEDLVVYPDIPQGSTNNIKQIRNFIRDRLTYVDRAIIEGNTGSDERYTELEYMESSGTQYIDTGISGGKNASYEIKFSTTGTKVSPWDHYFGGDNTTVPKLYNAGGNAVQAEAGEKTTFLWAAETDTAPKTVRYNVDGSIVLDGETKDNYDTVASLGWGNNSWYVFNSQLENTLLSNMRLYYLKMWTDGELVRDFIPVQRMEDAAVCLYDKVSGTFFENAGTGSFIGGNTNE